MLKSNYANNTRVRIKCQGGLTKQSHKDECDINKILAKYQKTGLISHINNHAAQYGDYDAVDFQQAMEAVKDGERMFSELPAVTRKAFNNDPSAFMEFVNDPNNTEADLVKVGLMQKKAEKPIDKSEKVSDNKSVEGEVGKEG